MEIQMLIKTKMLKNKDISCFQTLRCCIYRANKCLNANNCWHFNIYEHDTFHAHWVEHENKFNNISAWAQDLGFIARKSVFRICYKATDEAICLIWDILKSVVYSIKAVFPQGLIVVSQVQLYPNLMRKKKKKV